MLLRVFIPIWLFFSIIASLLIFISDNRYNNINNKNNYLNLSIEFAIGINSILFLIPILGCIIIYFNTPHLSEQLHIRSEMKLIQIWMFIMILGMLEIKHFRISEFLKFLSIFRNFDQKFD